MSNDDNALVMTVSEVAKYLRLTESTVYKLAQEGKLPGRKVGGMWRFSRKGLEEWLTNPGSAKTDQPDQGAASAS